MQGPIDPAGVALSAPSPLEVGWRLTDTDVYMIVVNPTGTAITGKTLAVTGVTGAATVMWENRGETVTNGAILDDFPAYGVHVYRIRLR